MPDFDYDELMAALASMPKTIDVQPNETAMDRFFRTDLPKMFDGCEVREEQIKMAKTIERALAERKHAIAEAGTGTGKSIAYMAPSILHALREHCRVIVSTGTIALQEQLVGKDLPFLAQMFPGLRYCLAKGKSNYVCPVRASEIDALTSDGKLTFPATVIEWLNRTPTGDRADFPGDPGPDWSKINVDESCPGVSKCPHGSECFYARARARWEDADVIVTNHTLLCIHLALQAASDGYAAILPEAGVVILDEAHHLEDEARKAFSIHVSSLRLPMLLAQAAKLASIPAEDIDRIRTENEKLFAAIRGLSNEQTFTLTGLPESVHDIIADLGSAVRPVTAPLRDQGEGTRAEKIADQVRDTVRDIAVALELDMAEELNTKDVTWAEVNSWGRDKERITLHHTPIDVAPALRSALWSAYPTVVATSATLAAGGDFGYWKQQVGCGSALELVVDSPFDYSQQGMMFIPKPGSIPEPRDPMFSVSVAPLIGEILERTDGRAFVLFTSYKSMNEIHDLLRPRLRWQVLRQGDGSKQELLRRFREDIHSVLFATSSFWEGVDIQGESLSCVIIVSLPFSVPTDPVTQARTEAIKARLGDRAAFMQMSLPEMILRLKQGVGRLIRSKSDRGIVAILDTRIRSKGYGQTVLDSLPPFQHREKLEDIEAFMAIGRAA